MITSHFELAPLILADITALNLPGLKTVDDETRLAGVVDMGPLVPAVILFTDEGDISDGADGRVQVEVQYWRLSVIVAHYHRPAGDSNTTASIAGGYLYPILQSLVGKSLHADFDPLEIAARPAPDFYDGEAVFDVVLKSRFKIEGV